MDADMMIVCEICGKDVWLGVAMWHECVDDDGRVPLCTECDAENPTGDCPND